MKLFHKLSQTAIILGTLMLSGLLVGCGSKKEESYRSIQVYDIDGKGWVTREDMGEMELYANMQLQSNDRVKTDRESYVQLKLDEDKYVLLEPNTVITIVAEGDLEDSKTKIVLEEGAVVNRIENKLSDNSSYEVETPSSTMAVRGTIFRVTVVMDKEGKLVSEVEVQEGKVECKIVVKKEDGTTKEETVTLEAGKKTIIEGTPEGAEYVGEIASYTYHTYENEVLNFIGYSENEEQMSEQPSQGKPIESDRNEDEKENQDKNEEQDKKENKDDINQEQVKEKKQNKKKNDVNNEDEADSKIEEESIEEPKEEAENKNPTPDTNIENTTGSENTNTENTTGSENTNTENNTGSGNTNTGSNTGNGSTNTGSNTGGSNPPGDSGNDEKYTVSFYGSDGKTLFATQTVTSGSTATEPTLMPTENGSWNFVFETPITANIDVTWNPTESTTP